MPARLIHKVDIDALMATEPWSRSAHFALHHIARRPSRIERTTGPASRRELSTGTSSDLEASVDNRVDRIWSGTVVPKRHARRAVTRSLLKRQIRAAFVRHEDLLAKGLWLVRLRRPFDPAKFVSAASAPLGAAAGVELEILFGSSPSAPSNRARPGSSMRRRSGRSD